MIESLKYTKELPDKEYNNYTISRTICSEHQFKSEAEGFAYAGAKQYRFIDLSKTPADEVVRNWDLLKHQNVCKANFIINNKNEMPKNKEDINQRIIFDVQKNKYVVPEEKVAILNSFPIFIYEYMK